MFNGDIGQVVGIDPVEREVTVRFDTREVGYDFGELDELSLAYAITIHKAQGATLDSALIDVGDNTFEAGQAYVALSRVKSIDALYIHDLKADAFWTHSQVTDFYRTVRHTSE